MYYKIMFILLTILFMSGSCDLGGKKTSISSKAQTALTTDSTPTETTPTDSTPTEKTPIDKPPTNALPPSIPTLTDTKPIDTPKPANTPKPIDTTPISLTDKHKDAIKFDKLAVRIMYVLTGRFPYIKDIIVKSVEISTEIAALKAAGITKLSEAKNMTDQDKLKELIKSLTFTFKFPIKGKYSEFDFIIIGDYENFKIIYEGLSNDKTDPALKPKLNINGIDIEFNQGFASAPKSSYFKFEGIDSRGHINYIKIYFPKNKKPAMISFLEDILGINGIENFKKHLP